MSVVVADAPRVLGGDRLCFRPREIADAFGLHLRAVQRRCAARTCGHLYFGPRCVRIPGGDATDLLADGRELHRGQPTGADAINRAFRNVERVTVSMLAHALDLTPRTIADWIASASDLPVLIDERGLPYFRPAALRAWLRARYVPARWAAEVSR